jgi:hypothetical protein
LVPQFEKGSVILFAGAGFSPGATNRQHSEPPDGKTPAALLEVECGWPYHGEELSLVYAQAEVILERIAVIRVREP